MASGVYQVTYHLDVATDGATKLVCTEKNVVASPVSEKGLNIPPDLSSLMELVIRQEHERRLHALNPSPHNNVNEFMVDDVPTLQARIAILESELSSVRCKAARVEEENKFMRAKIAELQAGTQRKSKPPRPPPLPPRHDQEQQNHANPLVALISLLRVKKSFKSHKSKGTTEGNESQQAAMRDTIERLKKGRITLRHVEQPEPQVNADVPASSAFAQELQAALDKLRVKKESLEQPRLNSDFYELEATAEEIVTESSSIPVHGPDVHVETFPLLNRSPTLKPPMLPAIEEASESLDSTPKFVTAPTPEPNHFLETQFQEEDNVEEIEFGTPSPNSLSPMADLTPSTSPLIPELFNCNVAMQVESGFESDSSTLTADSLEGNLDKFPKLKIQKSHSVPRLNSQWTKLKTILAQVRQSHTHTVRQHKQSACASSQEDLTSISKLDSAKKQVRFAKSSADLSASAFL